MIMVMMHIIIRIIVIIYINVMMHFGSFNFHCHDADYYAHSLHYAYYCYDAY